MDRDLKASLPRCHRVPANGACEITHRRYGRDGIVAVRGALDVTRAPALGIAVHRALATKPRRLVIDLCKVDVVDFRGLAVLLSARRRSLRLGVELRLACDVPSTLRLLAFTRVDRHFEVRPSWAEALSRQNYPRV